MRILLLCWNQVDNTTYSTVLQSLAARYHEKGHEVTVAGHYAPGPRKPAVEKKPWGELRRLGGARPKGLAAKVIRDLELLLPRFDAVHLHFGGYINPLLTHLTDIGVPVLATFQDYGNPIYRRPTRAELAVLSRALSRCVKVTALTGYMTRLLEADMPALRGKVAVIPDGFDPREARSARKTKPRRPFVLCVARLSPYKGIDVLLMAWSAVSRDFPGVDLVICGEDHLDGHLQGLARRLGVAGSVKFVGRKGRREVWGLFKSCLFSVLPSRHESFGIAALEAMHCGKAVIACESLGTAELVRDAGLLMPPKDPAAAGRALRRLLSDSSLRRKLGKKASARAARYSWDKIAPAYLGLLERTER
jgi:D-inositol-3-phosphate glycosyltransferase